MSIENTISTAIVRKFSDKLLDYLNLDVAIVGGGPNQVNVREKPGQTWMNVRDFDEACAILKEHGFTVRSKVFELKSMKTVAMRAPEGNNIIVVYHKREHDED